MIQGTDEWLRARLGKVTASRIADMVAKTKSGWGASRKNYAAELVIERLTGEPAPKFQSQAMLNGIECEPEARAAYAFYHDVEVEETGFELHPNIDMAGCSPDGLIGNDGLVEIKCPGTAQHIDTLLTEKVDDHYIKQIQFQMACMGIGRTWCDFVSYDKRLPEAMRLFVTRVFRDNRMISELEKEARIFLAEVDETVTALRARYSAQEAA